MSADPRRHGQYAWVAGRAKLSTNKARTEVWSYDEGAMREFHMDVFDGEQYVGHLTFKMRIPALKPA